MLEFTMVQTVLEKELSKFEPGLAELLDMPKPEEPGILRRELNALTEYDVLDPVRNFLRCYPKGRLNIEGHLCWLNASYSLNPQGVWEYALADLKHYENMISESDEFLPIKAFQTLLTDKTDAILLFMKEHPDELRELPVDTLESLLNELLENLRTPLHHHTFFIRLEKLLAERVKGGDESVRPVMDRLREILQSLGRHGKSTNKTRKYK
jgi:hypothetical protein